MGRSGYVKPGNWKTTKRRILERDGHACYLCGGPAQSVDHIINVASGGTHDDDNLAAICTPCHDAKTAAERRAGQRRQGQRASASRKRPPEPHPGTGV